MQQGRNTLCNCGSGKKYKKCCLTFDRQHQAKAHIKKHTIDKDFVYNYLKDLFQTK